MTPRSYCQLLAAVTWGLVPTLSTWGQEPLPAVEQQQSVQLTPTETPAQHIPAQLAPAQMPPTLDQIGPPMAPPEGAVAAQGPVSAPFQLSAVEEQFVDQILQQWENQSAQVKTFDCKFERWEYDPVFGPAEDPMIKSKGQLTYSKPDKGSFKIDQIYRHTQKDPAQPAEYLVQEHEVGEHWVCDGKAVYEYKHDKKQLVVQTLPEEMRGQSIVDGPLPFLFGAEAAKLKARYWIRTKQSDEATIWLEAYPRSQADAANYHHVEVMLDRKTMMPTAIQVHMPNGRNKAVYMFQDPSVNGSLNQLFGALFSSPRTPLGWTRVVQEAPPETGPSPQATNPVAPTQR
jgi:TIGR03009 family protein